MVSLETIVRYAAARGLIWPGSEIYGGLANTWDYGPLGVLLKNNIKRAWWKRFVQERLEIVGLDGAILMNPRVWEASGHLKTFTDPLVECRQCHGRFRADKIDVTMPCPSCGAQEFTEPAEFNLMFRTFMGPKEDSASVVYLRPETAQTMFVDFAAVLQTTRQRVPFGIAQVGKAFRNEITPGNFIFRTREFEQMEIEYFVKAQDWEKYFEEWLENMRGWMAWCGLPQEKIHEVEVPKEERAHYSQRTVDIEFDFPFGREELYGLAYRGDYDLRRHQQYSGKDLQYTDPADGHKYLPHVIEPTFGVDRTILAVLLSAYEEEEVKGEKRVVLKLKSELAPYQVAILPLSKKEELSKLARPLAEELAHEWSCDYDETQSIGKRYRRQDEIGTPYCLTVDFESGQDQQVTIRERDSMQQVRLKIDKVKDYLHEQLAAN
jgi:glycyl-tRNA synthetase